MAFNSDRFDLSNWKITLPVDNGGTIKGTAVEVKTLAGYESAQYFYDAPDGAMVFRASADGATTSGSSYARSELREMNGSVGAAWNLSQGGTMTATLLVDSVPIKNDGSQGRVVVGQIHGQDNELIRLYWEKDAVYFMNDLAGPSNKELRFDFKASDGSAPKISLGEIFSYKIDAHGSTLSVEIYADGKMYSSVTPINSVWQSDVFYFKAGLYMGVNETTGAGAGQASFYGLDFSHTAGGGFNGLIGAPLPLPTPDSIPTPYPTPIPDLHPAPDVPLDLRGDSKANTLIGAGGNDVIKGNGGDDHITGGAGNDELWGNGGKDIISGGAGADWIKGGDSVDRFVFSALIDAGDTIADFRTGEKVDISALLDLAGIGNLSSAELKAGGYVYFTDTGKNTNDLYVDSDGAHGAEHAVMLTHIIGVDDSVRDALLF